MKKVFITFLLCLCFLALPKKSFAFVTSQTYQPFGTLGSTTGTGFCNPAIALPIDHVTISAGQSSTTTCGNQLLFGAPPVGSTSGQFVHFAIAGSVSSGGSGNELFIEGPGAVIEYKFWADGFFSGNVLPNPLLGSVLNTAYFTIPITSMTDGNCNSPSKFVSNCGLEWTSPSNDRPYTVDGIEMYWDNNATSGAQLLPNAPITDFSPLYTTTTLSACGIDVGCILQNIFGVDTRVDTTTISTIQGTMNNKVPFAYLNDAFGTDFSATGTTSGVPAFDITIDDPGNPLVYHNLPHITFGPTSDNGVSQSIGTLFRNLVFVIEWFAFLAYIVSRIHKIL